MDQGTTVVDGKIVYFSIMCGDWVYPHCTSISTVKYPIEYPLVLMLYAPHGSKHKISEKKGDVNSHLNSQRRLHCLYNTETEKLRFIKLTNDAEPAFVMDIRDIRDIRAIDNPNEYLEFNVDRTKLARDTDMFTNVESLGSNSQNMWSVFVTSVLLQYYLAQDAIEADGRFNISSCDLYFRKATLNEIEAIGRW